MRYTRVSFSAVFAGLLVTAACDSFEHPVAPGTPGGPDATDRTPPWALDRPTTLDDEFARVAREEIPGFAGFYFDADGTPVIRLVDPEQRAAAEAYFQSQTFRGGRGDAMQMDLRPVIRGAAYDFAQLRGWGDRLEGMLDREDVYLLDVDEMHNRVHLGVRDDAAVSAVLAAAARQGIPLDAVHVELQPEPAHRHVQGWRNPLLGGIQIAFSSGLCTLGFNAIWNGQYIFVTNSHCTPGYFSFDGGPIYQHTFTAANHVGNEVNDRGLYNCVSGVANCRRSDAAYIGHNGSRGVDLGGIARTPWSFGSRGGLNITGRFQIQGKFYGCPVVGTWLDKTGRTSGSTYGQVTQTCVTIGNLRHQVVSNVWSEPGDSGSPMHVWQGGDNTFLQGILWGGPHNNWNVTYSSLIDGIEADLGWLIVH